MKYIIAILLIMSTISLMAQNGEAITEKKTFSRSTAISQTINTEPAVLWSILTKASDYARWNSTIISLEGKIEKGEKIRLKSTLDSSRTFKLKVKEMIPEEKLVWGDALGERTYTLEKTSEGTIFTMREKIGSFMFPLFANKIPSFDESFEAFTADLKREAESKK
ncbi:MAG: SRPBCC domain-containing protein [Cytophagales bacterium]